MSDNKKPDWDKITEGKIRHGVAVAFIEKGHELTPDNMKTMEKWVQFIIHGYHGIKEALDKNNVVKEEKLLKKIVDKFDGEIIKQTDEEYIKEQIEKSVVGLKAQDKNKVLYQLKNGAITLDNLQACLDKIEVMQSR
jgi:hypothetical protein|tara:strand:+ start:1058 stop:1468 length:411 start_codon:yes stop_codon:yes gene_type:complete